MGKVKLHHVRENGGLLRAVRMLSASASARTAARIHMTKQKPFNPGTSNGRVARAFATMPVPITVAYQVAPKCRGVTYVLLMESLH